MTEWPFQGAGQLLQLIEEILLQSCCSWRRRQSPVQLLLAGSRQPRAPARRPATGEPAFLREHMRAQAGASTANSMRHYPRAVPRPCCKVLIWRHAALASAANLMGRVSLAVEQPLSSREAGGERRAP